MQRKIEIGLLMHDWDFKKETNSYGIVSWAIDLP